MTRSYTLTVTETQAAAISRACEIVARLGIGQFRDALEQLPTVDFLPEGWHDDMQRIGEILSRHMIGGIDGYRSSMGIHADAVDESARILFDVHRVIRHRLSWQRAVDSGIVPSLDSPRDWSRMLGVHFDEPSPVASKEPLAQIREAAC